MRAAAWKPFALMIVVISVAAAVVGVLASRPSRTVLQISPPKSKGTPIRGERITLVEPPQWTNSGAWAVQGQSLLLVDALRRQVRRYDLSGRFVGALDVDYAKSKGLKQPSLVQGAGDGSILIEDEDGQLVQLNNQLQFERAFTVKGVAGIQGKVIALLWWSLMGNSELLAFGHIEAKGAVSGAVFRVQATDPANFKVLQKVSTDSPAHRFFLTGQSFLASVQGKPYYMIMDEVPYLATPDGRRLIPVRLTKSGSHPIMRPELPKRVVPETMQLLFKKLETAEGPMGIYGWKNYLYIIMRAPSESGLAWTLVKINPSTNQVVWNRMVDTTASHLVVIPGEKHWAFVEKGPVKGPGNQKVFSFLRVPSQIFEE